MGSRQKKGSTEGAEIQVKRWWDGGTPAIPERAINVLQMRARRDVRGRTRWSMEPLQGLRAELGSLQCGLWHMWA